MNGPADLWSSFSHDPRQPANAGLRASDADRGVIQQLLTEAYADGRLDREEFDSRSADAVGARTLGDLPALVSDLVATESGASRGGAVPDDDLQRQAVARYRSDRREAVLSFLGPSIVCVVIWASERQRAGLLLAGLRHRRHRDQPDAHPDQAPDMIESNRRRLEKKQQHREIDRKPDEALGGELGGPTPWAVGSGFSGSTPPRCCSSPSWWPCWPIRSWTRPTPGGP